MSRRDDIAQIIARWCVENGEEFLPNPLANRIEDYLHQQANVMPLEAKAEAGDHGATPVERLEALNENYHKTWQPSIKDALMENLPSIIADLKGRPAPAANTEGLRELRMGFIHGATWAGRSLKSATRVANLRYPPDASLRGEGK